MPVRLSLSAAKLVAKVELLRPDPKATIWSRLEPLPASDDAAESLQARIADPLWMLGRQWQFNEFQGEDAGSPVGAALAVQGVPVTSLAATDEGVAARPVSVDTPPVEALVEREQVLAAHPKLNAQAGQQLLRRLRALGDPPAVEALRAAWPATIAAPADPAADNAGFVWHRLLDGRSVDAARLAAELRAQQAGGDDLTAFAQTLGAADAAGFAAALTGWLAWLDDFVFEEATVAGASPYWDAQRLEYRFALQADAPQPPLRLEADEYTDGRLDWHSFTVGAAGTAPPLGAAPIDYTPARPPLPTVARYPGMPADRYWEFEDGRVNFGMLGAAKSDLTRVAVMEYALVFGNDWFLLPVTLPTNGVYHVSRLAISDNFGIEVPIPPARNADGSQWTMYEMSVTPGGNAPRARLGDLLYLCPAADTLKGPPLEHVLLMRDEMANLVWAIEKRVQGTSGEPLDRRYESDRLSTSQVLRPPAGTPPPPDAGALLSYTLQTPVAAHWIPFLPVRREGATVANWSIQLQRGVVVQHYQVTPERLADPRNADIRRHIERLRTAPFVEAKPEDGPPDNRLQGFMFHPRGQLLRIDASAGPETLRTTDFLRLADEEVPRDGVELKRAFNYARDFRGRGVLWLGRSKTTGRGEGASGLRFDVVKRGG